MCTDSQKRSCQNVCGRRRCLVSQRKEKEASGRNGEICTTMQHLALRTHERGGRGNPQELSVLSFLVPQPIGSLQPPFTEARKSGGRTGIGPEDGNRKIKKSIVESSPALKVPPLPPSTSWGVLQTLEQTQFSSLLPSLCEDR